jgi:hypothetical protein
MQQMSTRQDHVTQTNFTKSLSVGIFLTKRETTDTLLIDRHHLKAQLSSSISLKQQLLLIATTCLEVVLSLVLCTSIYAKDARWYRYYDSRGVPALSTSVSEQHLQYGYDVLDSNMQVLRRYPPFSAEKYAKQQASREQLILKKINDRHLQETYVSSDRATSQRDLELASINSQIEQSERESQKISNTLNDNVTAAARFERQNKPIPLMIKTGLEKNKLFLAQSNSNVTALKAKKEQTIKKFNSVIIELKRIEMQANKAKPTDTSRLATTD